MQAQMTSHNLASTLIAPSSAQRTPFIARDTEVPKTPAAVQILQFQDFAPNQEKFIKARGR